MLRASGRRAPRRPSAPLARALAATAWVSALLVFPGAPASSEAPGETRVQSGSAFAESSLLGVKVIYGNYAFPFSIGYSRASYQTSDAQAASHGVNLGALGAGAQSTCSGESGSGVPAPNQEPPFSPLEVESGSGPRHDSYGTAPLMVGEASAKKSPLWASARTSAIALDVPGLVTVSGHSRAEVDYAEDTQRAASAGVSTDIVLVGGLVKLSGLTWEVSDRSGVADESTGGFTVASIVVGGQTQSVGTDEQLGAAVAAANSVLKPVGIVIDLPVVEKSGSGVTASGLVVHILGNSVLNAIVQPLLQIKTPIQELLADLLSTVEDCNVQQLALLLGTAELLGDVVLGGLVGEGGVDLIVGGAEAGTAAPPDYEDPFGEDPPAEEEEEEEASPSADTPGPGSGPGPGPTDLTPPPTDEVPVAAQAPPVAAPLPEAYTVGCISMNTADSRPCSSGSSSRPFVGLLLGALGLFAADFVHSRRPRPIARRSAS